MNTVLITGGTGLIGSALSRLLIEKGYKVIILTRTARPSSGNLSYSVWNPDAGQIDSDIVRDAKHIIHLAGAGVADKRWSEKRKKEIVGSRVNGGRLIVNTLRETDNSVEAVISASGIGWYGADTPGSRRAFTESDPADTAFLGETCRLWEESIESVMETGKRLVVLRTGIVLSNEGGAFPEFRKAVKGGFAAILGSGRQTVSWIHIDDLCRLYLYAMENRHINGTYNAVAPATVSNKDLITSIARAKKRFYIPVHVPSFVLKLMLGEMSVEILKSTTVDGSKIRHSGFQFIYPRMEAAINALCGVS